MPTGWPSSGHREGLGSSFGVAVAPDGAWVALADHGGTLDVADAGSGGFTSHGDEGGIGWLRVAWDGRVIAWDLTDLHTPGAELLARAEGRSNRRRDRVRIVGK